jgi:membrane protease YdiL (CAAX protease family)
MIAIVIFVAITYALSILSGLLVASTGAQESAFVEIGFVVMFFPATAVLFVRLTRREGVQIDWDRFPVRYLPLALFLIPAVLHTVMLPMMALKDGGLPWLDWLTPAADGLYHTPPERGWGTVTSSGLAGRIAINAVVGLVVVSFLAFFEEVGWRAWLLPRLRLRIGARAAVVGTAVISALWHVPFQLSGIQQIEGVSAADLALGAPMGIVASGLIIGWLWLRTESIWIVSIAHGALNNWGQYAFKYMTDPTGPNLAEQVAGDLRVLGAGFLVLMSVGILLLWLGPEPRHSNHTVKAERA